MLPDWIGPLQGWLFAAVVVILIALEWLSPLRRRPDRIFPRWVTNIGLYLVAIYCLFLILPGGLLTVIISQPTHGLAASELPLWCTIPLTAVIVDAWRYWLHRWYHEIPLLWCAHLVHHSDTLVDVTTTERHHPLEAVMSLAGLLALVSVMGLPAEGIAVYALIAMVIALLSHSNIDLPPSLDFALRKVIITPAVHAIHHSNRQSETDSNYGAVLTVWDRLFGTYTPPADHRHIQFGLEYFREGSDEGLWRVLQQPFIFRARPTDSGDVPPHPPTIQMPGLLAASAAGFALLSLAFWPTFTGMVDTWAGRESWQYAFLVLPVFVYLVGWEFREELLRQPIIPGWSGLWLALPAGLVVLSGEILDINLGRQIGLVLCYQAIILAAVGGRTYLKYLPLWALLFLMVPYEDIAMPVLRAATLWSVETMSAITGLPFTANGYAFEVSGNHYEIVPACAGMSFFTLAVFLGYTFALITFRRRLPVLGFATVCGLAAVFANCFRVNTIIAGDLWRGTQADLAGHSPYRWVAFALMLALILLLVSRLRSSIPSDQENAKPKNPSFTRWWAPFAIAALGSLVAPGPAGLNEAHARDITNLPSLDLPDNLGQYRKQLSPSSWRGGPGRDTAHSSAQYSAGSSQWRVIVEVPLSNAAKLDPSLIEPADTGDWRYRRFDIRHACRGSQCTSYQHQTWQLGDTDEVYNVYTSYVIDGELTASKLAARLKRGLAKLLGTLDRTIIVAIASDDPIKIPAEVTEQLARVAASIGVPTEVDTIKLRSHSYYD